MKAGEELDAVEPSAFEGFEGLKQARIRKGYRSKMMPWRMKTESHNDEAS
jgi:hypothetical protein